jgi:UPF0716 protein FxsA
MPFFLALMALWSFLEIAGLIAVGRLIGIAPTIALMVLSGLLGGMLLRVVGIRVLMETVAALQTGKRPDLALAHAGLTAFGGFLLILPGFVSDVVGLALFLKPVRSAVIAVVAWMIGPVVVVRTETSARRTTVVDLDPDEWRHGGRDARPPTAGPARLSAPDGRDNPHDDQREE